MKTFFPIVYKNTTATTTNSEFMERLQRLKATYNLEKHTKKTNNLRRTNSHTQI